MTEQQKKATEAKGTIQRLMVGKVISHKMQKTAVVEVDRTYMHPRLHKVVRTSTTYKVHDAQDEAAVGDTVEFYEGRPVSKTKYMYLHRVVSRS